MIVVPYKSKQKNRAWHRDYMRKKRAVTPVANVTPVTPVVVTPRFFRPVPKPTR